MWDTDNLIETATFPIWSRQYSQLVDQLTIGKYGIPSLELMERAGEAVAEYLIKNTFHDQNILILAGPGNNGGDALVAAWHLAQAGRRIHISFVNPGSDEKISTSCQAQLNRLEKAGIPYSKYQRGSLSSSPDERRVVLDGLVGIGVAGWLREGLFTDCLREVDGLKRSITIAIDIPSGMDADNWSRQEALLPADVTITFGGPKPVHLLSPARSQCGQILVKDIGFAAAAIGEANSRSPNSCYRVNDETILRNNPWNQLSEDCHKFDRGHVLIIGGGDGKTGAPLLAGLAALRSGAGWVTIALPTGALTLQSGVPLELTFENLFENGKLDAQKLEMFTITRKVKAIAIGCGMSTTPLTPKILELLARLSKEERVFLVFDAGGLQSISSMLINIKLDPDLAVLTPHPGEWHKIGDPVGRLNLPTDATAIAGLLTRCGISLFYKTATPFFFDPLKERLLFTNSGTNALARAGSGDILAGAIAAHGAMGMGAALSTLRSQVLINTTASTLVSSHGKHAILASDIVNHLGINNG